MVSGCSLPRIRFRISKALREVRVNPTGKRARKKHKGGGLGWERERKAPVRVVQGGTTMLSQGDDRAQVIKSLSHINGVILAKFLAVGNAVFLSLFRVP